MIAVPTVLIAVAEVDDAVVVRLGRVLEKPLHENDGFVEAIVVHRSAEDVNLALERCTERLPVSLKDVTKVVVLASVGGDLVIDLPCTLVPSAAGIAIVTDGSVHQFPDVSLIARAGFRSEGELAMVHLLDDTTHNATPIAMTGPQRRLPIAPPHDPSVVDDITIQAMNAFYR